MLQPATSRTRRPRRKEQGQANVEFALSIMAVLLVVFFSWELLMAMYTMSVLADAAKEGVRYAIVHGSDNGNCSGPGCTDASATNVKNVVTGFAQTSLHDVSAISVTVTYPDNSSTPPSRVVVVVAYTFVPYINVGFSPTLTTQAQGRIVN